MYKNFFLSLSVCFLWIQPSIYGMIQEDFYSWMTWKTSKEYVICEKPINILKELDIKKNKAKYHSGLEMLINNKVYWVLNSTLIPMHKDKNPPYYLDNPFSITGLCGPTISYIVKNGKRTYYLYCRQRIPRAFKPGDEFAPI